MHALRAGLGFSLLIAGSSLSAIPVPVPDRVSCGVADVQDFTSPDHVHLTGWVGQRIAGNEANRLVKLDLARLLEGYRRRPGRQSWDGEHVGKWLHAATLAWVNTGDPALRAKLDLVASELCRCQLADGYLGTYLDADRWTEWDVWAHKYNLIGLLTYLRYTGNLEALSTCRRMADLLCRTFGDQPGQRDILKAGFHAGMAPTSVLEPMVLLYRLTGEPRYLEFCHFLVRAWELPDGPHFISTLLGSGRVDRVGNAKAYEMLSCLNGALELYRTEGDRRLLDACLNAWQDILDHRLYLTGAASVEEHFRGDYELPNTDRVGETCVTVTWLQLNAQLLRLTGEARFAEQLERVVLNQLLGAQQPDGSAWGYYVQMEGKKPYTATLDGQCCLSSGPRGVALIPTFAITTDADGVIVNLYDAGTAALTLRDGTNVALATETAYPYDGHIRLKVDPTVSHSFAVKLRLPAWCEGAHASVNGSAAALKPARDGYAVVSRAWQPGDVIELELPLAPRVVVGDHLNQGKAAVLYGPLVLAAEDALLMAEGQRASTIALAGADLRMLDVTPEPAPENLKTWPGARVFRAQAVAHKPSAAMRPGDTFRARLIPFADAGATGSRYRVWLPIATLGTDDLLLIGEASCSQPAADANAINDDDAYSWATASDPARAQQTRFAVALAKPADVRRIVFVQGKILPEGGWFDTSAGKPLVQVQRKPGAPWETVGELADYPATTANDHGLTERDRSFELRLPEAIHAAAVRVIGVPACVAPAGPSVVTCGELRAFAQ